MRKTAKELGYKVGDMFLKTYEDSDPYPVFENGSTLMMVRDDGSFIPKFKLIEGNKTRFMAPDGTAFEDLAYVTPMPEKAPAKTKTVITITIEEVEV